MILVALTGSIATGKSTVAKTLSRLGAVIIDTDKLARAAVASGSAGLKKVVERFGPGVLTEDGNLDRAAMRARIFSDEAARADLGAIIHPIIQAEQVRLIAQARAADPEAVIVVDIPLLYEVDRARDFEAVIVAYVDRRTQLDRLMARDDCDEAAARAAMASQLDIEDKRTRADYVIDNAGGFDEARQQTEELFKKLKARALKPLKT